MRSPLATLAARLLQLLACICLPKPSHRSSTAPCPQGPTDPLAALLLADSPTR